MPKGYWIGHVTVDDPQAYEAYRAANATAFAKYGARFFWCAAVRSRSSKAICARVLW